MINHKEESDTNPVGDADLVLPQLKTDHNPRVALLQVSVSSTASGTKMHSITCSPLSRKHFQVSHTPMVHRAAMSLHRAFDLTMRYIFKITSSVEKDRASESERLYQAQNLIHSPLNLPNHPHPPSISQQEQEPSSSPQYA